MRESASLLAHIEALQQEYKRAQGKTAVLNTAITETLAMVQKTRADIRNEREIIMKLFASRADLEIELMEIEVTDEHKKKSKSTKSSSQNLVGKCEELKAKLDMADYEYQDVRALFDAQVYAFSGTSKIHAKIQQEKINEMKLLKELSDRNSHLEQEIQKKEENIEKLKESIGSANMCYSRLK